MTEIIQKVAEMTTGTPDSEADKDHQAIVQGLIWKRGVWYPDSSILTNWWFFLCQKHVLLGIACCHKLHPYTRLERMFVWISCVITSIGLSLLFSDASFGEGLSEAQIQCYSLAISCYLATKAILMRSLVTCGIVQDGSCLQVAASVLNSDAKLKRSCERIGCRVAAFSCVISLMWFIAGVCVVQGEIFNYGQFFEEFFLSQIYSWLIELGTVTGRFLMGWYGFRCVSGPEGTGDDEVKKAMTGKYPEGIEYPKDKNRLWENDRALCKGCFSEAPQTVDGTVEPAAEEKLPGEAKV